MTHRLNQFSTVIYCIFPNHKLFNKNEIRNNKFSCSLYYTVWKQQEAK